MGAFPVTPPAQSHTGTIVTQSQVTRSQEMCYYQAPSSSYGVPQAPPLDSANSFYTNNNNLPQPQQAAFYLYRGYEDDVYLLVKLGEAALVVSILYMIVSCCLAAARNQK